MACDLIEFAGKELGQHGCNVYFKEFIAIHQSKKKRYKLGEFYFVKSLHSQTACVAEFQLIWQNLKTGQKLASLKLYFSPEDTPEGRLVSHGEDELIEADQHVAIECSQMCHWECDTSFEWQLGTQAYRDVDGFDISAMVSGNHCHSHHGNATRVKLLSFPAYCRYRACVEMLKTGATKMERKLLLMRGGVELPTEKTNVMFCRWRFHHPSLENCCPNSDVKLPVFKGRPRKRKLKTMKVTVADGKRTDVSLSNELKAMGAVNTSIPTPHEPVRREVATKKESNSCKAKFKPKTKLLDVSENELDILMTKMSIFMKERGTPILKIPKVGYTRVNLALLFTLVHAYGGYKQVTLDHRWKVVYDGLGLATTITNAATCIRRHYERLLLPYEKHLRNVNKGRLHFGVSNPDDGKNGKKPTSDVASKAAENKKTIVAVSPPRVVNDSCQTTTMTESCTQTDTKDDTPRPRLACEHRRLNGVKARLSPSRPIDTTPGAVENHVTSSRKRSPHSVISEVPVTVASPRDARGSSANDITNPKTVTNSLLPKTITNGTEQPHFPPPFSSSSCTPRPPPLVRIKEPASVQDFVPDKKCRYTTPPCPPSPWATNGSHLPGSMDYYKKISIASLLPDMKMKDVESLMKPITKDMHGTLEDIRRAVSKSVGFQMPATVLSSTGTHKTTSANQPPCSSHCYSPSYSDSRQRHFQQSIKTEFDDSYNRYGINGSDHHSRGERLAPSPLGALSESQRELIVNERLVNAQVNRMTSPNERFLPSKDNVMFPARLSPASMRRFPAEFYGWPQNHDSSLAKRRQEFANQCHWPTAEHKDRAPPHMPAYCNISKTF